MVRRGQAAMEFLSTYGWAILVVIAAIGALAYFGVLSPDKALPSKCMASAPFTCTEYKITPAGLLLSLRVTGGNDLSFANLSVQGCTPGTLAVGFTAEGGLLNGSMMSFACATGSVGDRYRTNFTVVYMNSGESVTHISFGDIQGRVE